MRSDAISLSSPTMMRRNAVGQCQQQSPRPSVVSSRSVQHGSSCLWKNAKNTLKIQNCKPPLHTSNSDRRLTDISSYREQVERGNIKLLLSGAWPAILYDESMIEDDNELPGLFRSETLLRVQLFDYFCSVPNSFRTQCGITILCSPSAGRAWTYPDPDARSCSATQKESNAEINGITKITPETIAYFATLVRHRASFLTEISNQRLTGRVCCSRWWMLYP